MSTTSGSGKEQPVPGQAQAEPQPEREEPRRDEHELRPRRRDQQPNAAQQPGVMIPSRGKRLPFEAPLMRLVATAGIVAIGVVISAIMTSQHSKGWLIGLVVAIVSVLLAAVLWSSRRL